MTTSNNNYTNEMLNQELSFQVLKAAAGGFKPNRTGINGDGLSIREANRGLLVREL